MSDDAAVWLDYHESEVAKRDKRIKELEAQLATVRAERDALAAENARLRSAFAEMLPVATGALDDEGHVDVRRWRELEAALRGGGG